MALSPQIITSSILGAGANNTGPNFKKLANAIGISLYTWIISPSNFFMVGSVNGTAGAGIVFGKLLLSPNVGLVLSGMNSAGVNGTLAPDISSAIAIGVSSAISSSGNYTGPSVGVGVGADVSFTSFVNTPILSMLILSNLGFGESSAINANGCALGISNLLLTMQGVGAVSGLPSIIPGSGVSPQSVVV